MSCAFGAMSMLNDMVLILFADITVIVNKFHLVARSHEDVSALVRNACVFYRKELPVWVNLFKFAQPTDDTLIIAVKTKREPYGAPFFQPRLSRFGAHLPMGVLPCGDGDFVRAACSRFVALAALFIATASR